MKKNHIFVILLLFIIISPCFGLSFNITFTGSGVRSNVGDVLVQNLTTGTTVTRPSGNTLNLSDGQTAVAHLSADDQTIRVFSNSEDGISTISFYAKQTGNAQINAFSIDGKKIVSIAATVQTGNNSFKLSLPKGFYAIQVTGKEYSYSARMINQSSAPSKPSIVLIGTENLSITGSQKSKSTSLATTTMSYSAGDRLLFTGKSGVNNNIVTDVPTGDKTINFEFVTCADGDGNNYKVVKIGNQTWMAENLKTSKYNDGTDIPLVTSSTIWAGMFGPAYCLFDNIPDTN